MKNLKKICSLACALILTLSLAACGGGEPTVDELLDGMPDGGGVTAKMQMNMGMDMTIMGQSMSMTMESESRLEQDGTNVHSESTTTMTSSDGESDTQVSDVYSMKNDDGTYTEYIGTDGSWSKYVYEDPTVGLTGAMDVPTDGFTMTKSDGEYVVSGTINLADALQAMGDTSTFDAFGLSVEDMVNTDGNLDVQAEYHFDAKTKAVKSFSLDMGSAMNTLMNQMMDGAMAEAAEGEDLGEDFDLSALITIDITSMTLTVTDIQTDDSITVSVPDDVVASAVEVTVGDE